jgi:hypothetical protein
VFPIVNGVLPIVNGVSDCFFIYMKSNKSNSGAKRVYALSCLYTCIGLYACARY